MDRLQISNISSTLVAFPEGRSQEAANSTNASANVKVNASTVICSPKLRKCTISDTNCKHFSLVFTPKTQFPFSKSDTVDDSH